MANIVQNTDKAYGYKYTSLAGLAQAGVDIPKMRTSTVEGRQFVEYLDDDGLWQRGAEIVVPDMKGMNAAQAYGSALTYARRYTVMMAKSVVCTDDQLLENQEPESAERTYRADDTPPEAPDLTGFANFPNTKFVCERCGQEVREYENNGKTISVARHIKATQKQFGKILCLDCVKALQKAAEAGAE